MKETGLSKLANSVSNDIAEENKVEKITSNEMFKNSLMSFIDNEMENINDNNIEVLTDQQNIVNQKLFELMDEDALEVSDVFRFSDMLAKQKNQESNQKVSKINALFDILKPTKDSANPLLNNNQTESENNVSSEMSPSELQVLLKVTQLLQGVKNTEE